MGFTRCPLLPSPRLPSSVPVLLSASSSALDSTPGRLLPIGLDGLRSLSPTRSNSPHVVQSWDCAPSLQPERDNHGGSMQKPYTTLHNLSRPNRRRRRPSFSSGRCMTTKLSHPSRRPTAESYVAIRDRAPAIRWVTRQTGPASEFDRLALDHMSPAGHWPRL